MNGRLTGREVSLDHGVAMIYDDEQVLGAAVLLFPIEEQLKV